AENVAHRQIDDGAMRFLAQSRIMPDHGVSGGKMLAMADQRTLVMTGGAGRIDDESRIGRRKSRQFLLEPGEVGLFRGGQQIRKAVQLLVRIAEHCGSVEHDDRAQGGQPVDHRQDLVDIFLVLGDEDAGAAVPHLVLDLGRRSGRINSIGDGAERLRGEIADHPFFADVAHDGDALATDDAEVLQRACRMRDQRRVVAPAALAINAEVLGTEGDRIRHRSRPLAQQMRSGGAAQPVAIDRNGHRALFPRFGSTRNSIALSNSISARASSNAGGHRRLRRIVGRLPIPSVTRRANSSAMSVTSMFSLRCQLDAALHMPSMAKVAMRMSRSARNSPLAMPSLITSSKMRSSPRDQRPMRRRLSRGRCWRSLRNTLTKSARSTSGDRCDSINKISLFRALSGRAAIALAASKKPSTPRRQTSSSAASFDEK